LVFYYCKRAASPEGSGIGFLFRGNARLLRRGWRVYGGSATVREAISFCGIMRRLRDGEKKPRDGIRPPGARPPAGCRAVMGGKRNGCGVWDKAAPRKRRLSLTEPWG
jgi:hypothetical protein